MSGDYNPYLNMSQEELIAACVEEDPQRKAAHAENMEMLREYICTHTSSSSAPRRRRAYIERNRAEGHNRLFKDYFAPDPVYTDEQFRRRFRMRRNVFLRIVSAVSATDPYFQQSQDASGKDGLSTLQKCTAALRMLAYGMPADCVDEYIRIGETTTLECVKKFVKAIVQIFQDEYLRKPNNEDIERLLQWGETRGFSGMMGSIDCMHWEWKNCPVAWKGQYSRGHGKPTIMLEAVASRDLWIWHAFFGVPGSNNDLNVLARSPLFDEIYEGQAPQVTYKVNQTKYTLGYYLADGIYPEWSTFVKTIPLPQGPKRKLFAERQEGARKDVERAFGVLQTRFAIVRGPARIWKPEILKNIMLACIIMHNMIVEDERDTYAYNFDAENTYDQVDNGIEPAIRNEGPPLPEFWNFLSQYMRVRDRAVHNALQADLVEHLWLKFRQSR